MEEATEHQLKVNPEFFHDLVLRRKRFEVRKNNKPLTAVNFDKSQMER